MLTSLFGDLGKPRSPRPERSGADADEGHGFAATAILESVAADVNDKGQLVDRHSSDLIFTGSAAQAIRSHFASTRADLDRASRMITLLDPTGVWASAVIRALSDAGGQPVERLHLREQGTLRTLATVERTTLVRRHEDTLKIVHADVRAPGRDSAEIPMALMERSHLTTVIVGPMSPHGIDDLIAGLCTAARLPTWRCPHLLFMLPPGAVWIANKVGSAAWPPGVQVHMLSEPLVSASSVWNAMLGLWNRVKAGSAGRPARPDIAPPGADLPSALAVEPMPPAAPPALRVSRPALDPVAAREALATVAALEGLLGCAVVDSSTGLVIARDGRSAPPLDLDLAAAACAQVMRAHRQAARSMGMPEQIDEIMTSAGPRQMVMRTLTRHPSLFLVAMLEKHRANLALARYTLSEVEKTLG